jgi:hypothetical protein
MDAFYERVLGDDSPLGQHGALGVQTTDETAPLELPQEPELTQF